VEGWGGQKEGMRVIFFFMHFIYLCATPSCCIRGAQWGAREK